MQKVPMCSRALLTLFGIVSAGALFLSLLGTVEASDGNETITSECTYPFWRLTQVNHGLTVGSWYGHTFTASGTPVPTYSLRSGGIPAGMTMSSTGMVAGTPTAAGTYSFQLNARNACGTAASPTITMSVGSAMTSASTVTAPAFTAQAPPTTATVGRWYSYTFMASGDPAPAYTVASGALPAGLALDATSGRLIGAPTTVGSYSFRVSARNSAGTALTPTLTIRVADVCTAPAWDSVQTSHSLTVGSWYSYTFAASGAPAPVHSLRSGSIPPGMRLSSTGVASGTPTAAGTYSFQLTASNSCGSAASPTVTMRVVEADAAPLAIETVPQPMLLAYGKSVSHQFVAAGGAAPYRFYQSGGTMPAGLSLSSDGRLSGTVLAWPGQDFIWFLSVIDSELGLYGTAVWMRVE